jgi:hypothetical protein
MFIYLTVCKVNGKKYIGKYEGKETDRYLGSGKLLRRAIKKYGEDQFERMILEKFNSAEECREGEKKWIARFDATSDPQFYNIASGGEGGNTFQGIQGEERIKLIAKLKNRKKREKDFKGTMLAYDVETKTRIRCTIEEFYNTDTYLGNSCKGLYITPEGVFSSAKIASKYHQNLDYTSLSVRCKMPHRKVTKAHLAWDYRIALEQLGKSFEELGYRFLPLEEITLEFIKNNKIVKL